MSSSPFFALPPELRIRMYELVIVGEPLYLAFTGVVSKPYISAACKQIRAELLSVFTKSALIEARSVQTTVTDFDFTALIRLLQAAVRVRVETDDLSVHIKLDFTESFLVRRVDYDAHTGLAAWLCSDSVPTSVAYSIITNLSNVQRHRIFKQFYESKWEYDETSHPCGLRQHAQLLHDRIFDGA